MPGELQIFGLYSFWKFQKFEYEPLFEEQEEININSEISEFIQFIYWTELAREVYDEIFGQVEI